MHQIDFKKGIIGDPDVCDGEKPNRNYSLFGLADNDNVFKTRAKIDAPEINVISFSSKGEWVLNHTESGAIHALTIVHNGTAYTFKEQFVYKASLTYCDIPQSGYARPLLLGNNAEFVVEVFSNAPSRIAGRFSPDPNTFSSYADIDLEGATLVNSYNGYLSYGFRKAKLVKIILPYNDKSASARVKTVLPYAAAETQAEMVGFEIFPNPVREKLIVNLPEDFKEGQIEITDIMGTSFMRAIDINKQDSQSVLIDTQPLATGIYVLNMRYISIEGLRMNRRKKFVRE